MSHDGPLDIAEVVARTGVQVTTLHVWERKGLITPIGRSGLRRLYDPSAVSTIAVIVLAQQSGFTLTEIGALLAPGAFSGGKEPLRVKLDELRAKRATLDRAIESLEHALDCPHADPLTCPDFLASLDAVLPRAEPEGR